MFIFHQKQKQAERNEVFEAGELSTVRRGLSVCLLTSVKILFLKFHNANDRFSENN